MPNIELHGYSSDNADALRKVICNIVRSLPDANEIVITTVADHVEDLNGNSLPFIRVVSSPDDNLLRLIERLSTVREDIEVLHLGTWIPKE